MPVLRSAGGLGKQGPASLQGRSRSGQAGAGGQGKVPQVRAESLLAPSSATTACSAPHSRDPPANPSLDSQGGPQTSAVQE